MKRILILKTGETAAEVRRTHGDYDRWFIDAVPRKDLAFAVRDAMRGSLPDLSGLAGVIVTGSTQAAYRHEPWMVPLAELLRRAGEERLPALCVCFGAQMLAQALGGRVALNPEGWEIGGVEIALTAEALQDPLFAGLPPRIGALTTHEDRIDALPPGAVLLAWNASSPVQAFRAGETLWGVQFHPEATAGILEKLIRLRSGILARQAASRGRPADGHLERLLATLARPEAAQGRKVLDNFVTLCLER